MEKYILEKQRIIGAIKFNVVHFDTNADLGDNYTETSLTLNGKRKS